MRDPSIETSRSLVLRTAPFLLIRVAVYFGIAAAFVVAAGGGAGIGLGIGTLAGPAGRAPGAFWGAIAGLAFVGGMYGWLRESILYLVRAGHVAAMAAALAAKKRTGNSGRVSQAMNLVQQRFRDIGVLFEMNRLVQNTVAAMASLPGVRGSSLPAGIQASPALTGIVLRGTNGFLNEIVLARLFRLTTKNVWAGTRDTLVLVAQNHVLVLPQAMRLAAIVYGAVLAIFLISFIPAAALARTFPGEPTAIAFPLAAIFAWSVKQALLDPVAAALLLPGAFRAIEDQSPDPDWEAALAEVSQDFSEIKARAAAAPRGPRRSIVV